MTYRERREARAERLRGWAEKREARSSAAFSTAARLADAIPMGQPILVGHHSEKRHRRDLDRIHNNMSAGVEHQRKAEQMTSRADNIEAAADGAIYSDDPDAIDALTAKLSGLEAQRARVKAVNAMIRKRGLSACLPDLTEGEKASLLATMRACPYHHVETRGYPAYHLTNLGGNITRTRKRIESLSGQPKIAAAVQAVGDTATARAGLIIKATMTTPSRPGKQPRPVWNVGGNLAFWRPMLTRAGGNFYHGVFSFWEDPTDDIETACGEAEASEPEPHKCAECGQVFADHKSALLCCMGVPSGPDQDDENEPEPHDPTRPTVDFHE